MPSYSIPPTVFGYYALDMGLTPGYGSPPGPKYTSTRACKGTLLANTNQTDKMQRQPHQEPERLLSSTIKVALTTT